MISARDELKHAVTTLTPDECERVLDFIRRLSGPHCPNCFNDDLDTLVIDAEYGDWAHCEQCDMCFLSSRPVVMS